MSLLIELAKYSNPSLAPGSLEEQYYLMLKREVPKEEAMRILFNDVESPKRRLSHLGTKLKWKMIASIAGKIDQSEKNYADSVVKAHQLFAAGSVLIVRQSKKPGVDLLEKGFSLAIRIGLINIALECAKFLIRYYSTIEGNKKKYEYYQEHLDDLLERYLAETKAQSYLNEVTLYYANHWHKDVSAKAFTYAALIEETIDASIKTAMYYFSMLNLAFISSLDFKGLVDNANAAIAYFSKFEDKPRASIEIFLTKKAVGYIQLNRYDEALKALNKCIYEVSKPGSYAWCSAQFYKGIIGLHTKDIELTLNAIADTTKYQDDLPENINERWNILTAYTALFLPDKFRVAKFINEVPIFEKDKASANFAILTVQMLHFLKQGNEEAYTERCDALMCYTSRYLKGKSKVLAKMLIEISRGHFSKVSVDIRTEKLRKQLKGYDMEIEIMPYTKVWEMAVDLL